LISYQDPKHGMRRYSS